MNIELNDTHRLVDATAESVTLVTANGETVVFTHSAVVQLLKAMNAVSTKAAIAARDRQG